MHFFRSREDADIWAKDHNGLTILEIGEGSELAQEHWVEPLR